MCFLRLAGLPHTVVRLQVRPYLGRGSQGSGKLDSSLRGNLLGTSNDLIHNLYWPTSNICQVALCPSTLFKCVFQNATRRRNMGWSMLLVHTFPLLDQGCSTT